ncbi:MAG: peptidoglycan DD-metalloendopeptidase family protein, partial [Geminicoccaceae bacterium]
IRDGAKGFRGFASNRPEWERGAIVNAARNRRVLLWALPIVFGIGVGTGVIVSRVTNVAGDASDVAQRLPDIKDEPARVIPATPDARARHARIEAGPSPLRPAAAISVAGTLQAPPKRALLLAATATRSLPPVSLGSDAERTQEARLARAALRPDPRTVEQVTVRRGDTLSNILDRARIDAVEAHAVVQSLRGVYDPRRLRAGQELLITALDERDAGAARRLMGLALDLDFESQIQVTRGPDGSYSASRLERPHRRELVSRAGTIDDSLFLSADRAAVPRSITVDLIRLFSWDVDFQRDIRAGDGFEALFEEVSLEDDTSAVRGGDLLYGGLTLSGEALDAFRFEPEGGEVEYFDRTGRSLRKFLLRTPVDGARLSSRFGMRKHPILGYSLMHKGIDFAAPKGTPIFAAGGGRVVAAGRNGGYGNYIRIRHSGEYSTAYAHLSRFAKGVKPGQRVRQGQVIGYVGTTGRSTGPHLHYEVLRNDQQINPLKIKQPPTMQLAGADLERFNQEVARIDRLRGELTRNTQVASKADQPRASPVAAIR